MLSFISTHSLQSSRARSQRGFTLVELLVVIAMLGILAAAVLTALNPAQQLARARDVSRRAAVKNMSSAIQRYMTTASSVPPINRNPCCGYGSDQPNFLKELIDSGELKQIPKDPSGGVYYYYDYGAGNNIGAIVVTTLESIQDTTVAPEGSCRPFGNNWCSSTIPSKYYCVCNPY